MKAWTGVLICNCACNRPSAKAAKNPSSLCYSGFKDCFVCFRAYSPAAAATSRVTPGPMVELSAIFFI